MVKPVVDGSTDCILSELKQADYGEHNLLIYPHLTALEEVYSQYFKSRLESNKENILFLSTYQSVDSVRRILRTIDLDVIGYEENGSLIILDSVRGYFGSESDVLSLVKVLSKSAHNQGRKGCCVIADMGSFYLVRKVQELLKYEMSVPLKFGCNDNLIKCKCFCCYHQKDFLRLPEHEKQVLFEHHYRNLIIVEDNIKINSQPLTL